MTSPEGLCGGGGSRTEVMSQETEGATSNVSPAHSDEQGQARQPGRNHTLPYTLPADSVQIDK